MSYRVLLTLAAVLLLLSCRQTKVIEIDRQVKIDTVAYYVPSEVITHSFKVDTIKSYQRIQDRTKLIIERHDSLIRVECEALGDTIKVTNTTETIIKEALPNSYKYSLFGALAAIMIMLLVLYFAKK